MFGTSLDKLIVYVLTTIMAYSRRSRAPFYRHQTASSCIGLFGVHTVPCAGAGLAHTMLPVGILLALVAMPCKIIVHKLADSFCCDPGGLLLRNSKKSSHEYNIHDVYFVFHLELTTTTSASSCRWQYQPSAMLCNSPIPPNPRLLLLRRR